MLSGMQLVHPQYGLKVFCLMVFAAVASRLVAIWLLEVWPEVPVKDSERDLDEIGSPNTASDSNHHGLEKNEISSTVKKSGQSNITNG